MNGTDLSVQAMAGNCGLGKQGIDEGLEIVLNLAELEKHPLTILDELGTGTGRLQEFIKHDRGSFISGVLAEWDTLARNLVGLLETAERRMEDYRFYSIQLLYLLHAGHTKSVKKSYITTGQRRIADEAAKWICQNLRTVTTVEQLAAQAGFDASALRST